MIKNREAITNQMPKRGVWNFIHFCQGRSAIAREAISELIR